MESLWPDSGMRAASNSLRGALHASRRILAPDPKLGPRYLASQDETLVLCPEGRLWVDVEAFEEASAMTRRSQHPAAYLAASQLYTGELLPEDRYEDWMENRREGLRRLYLELLVEVTGLYKERQDYGQAIETIHRILSEEPNNEEAHADLMRLYAISGRQGEALTHYDRLREIFRTAW